MNESLLDQVAAPARLVFPLPAPAGGGLSSSEKPPMPYAPRHDSLPFKVMEFFAANPDEELGVEDIALKFGVDARGVHTQLGHAVVRNALIRERGDDGEFFYRKGPEEIHVSVLKARHPVLAQHEQMDRRAVAQPRRPYRGGSAGNAAVDLSKVRLESDVPLPSNCMASAIREQISGLLMKMTVGDSYLLPLSVRRTVDSVVKDDEFTFLTFLRRAVDGQNFRIWRTK
ncbi:hypothetical protein [Variovorax sp. VNK109]|uniref:hypothetical protein n=1 Tax=Variovorax sp. VNK109 TaxID=3400919 RepID=UPI003C2C639A